MGWLEKSENRGIYGSRFYKDMPSEIKMRADKLKIQKPDISKSIRIGHF